MDIRDGWATEYNRKNFSSTVDEHDWVEWLLEFVVPDGGVLPDVVPREVKSRVMRLLAYTETAQGLSDWGMHEGDDGLYQRGKADVTNYKAELTQWADALKAKFFA